jgi:hypothetical protein
MQTLAWFVFIDQHPAAHLVAGVIPDEQVASANTRNSLALLAKLAKRLELKGKFAMTVERRSGRPEIHCAFEKADDATKFARAVDARDTSRYANWASQRQFGLDAAAVTTITKVLEWVDP